MDNNHQHNEAQQETAVIDERHARILCFSIGQEEFGMPLLDVKEVIALPEVTPIPYTPTYFLGIMNLRGNVISIFDLRVKFNIKTQKTLETSVIICDFGTTCIGVVVDSVSAVLSPKPNEISAKPEIQSSKASDYITSVLRRDQRLIVLLDMKKTLGDEDFATANKMSKAA